MSVDGLDQPCGVCDRESGAHTLREWAICLGTVTTDLPFEQVPADMAQAAGAAVRQKFGLDANLIVADSVVVRAAVLDGYTGPVGVKIPVVLHDFQIAVPGHPPQTVAEIAYVGDDDAMRAYGRLIRDSANGAANGAKR